jgi:hypothetical protein
MKIKLYFKWFNFWVGFFYDRPTKTLYIGYFPMLGIKISLVEKTCERCGSSLLDDGYCRDITCPHSDYLQHETWIAD